MLAIFTGVDIYSVTLIVVAFMGGLGLGSMVGGYLSDRLTNRYRLLLFAFSELTIAAFASNKQVALLRHPLYEV